MSEGTEDSPRRGHAILIISIVAIVIILLAAAWLSLTVVADLPVTSDTTYPYTVTYHASVLDGREVSIGGVPFLALSSGDEVIVKSGDRRERIGINETRTVTERRARVTTLGISLLDTNYRMNATFSGTSGDSDLFDISLQTSRQVPAVLLDRMIPPGVVVRPV